jgi:hypothetical protein
MRFVPLAIPWTQTELPGPGREVIVAPSRFPKPMFWAFLLEPLNAVRRTESLDPIEVKSGDAALTFDT